MVLDCVLAQVEGHTDLAVREAFGDHAHNLLLPFALVLLTKQVDFSATRYLDQPLPEEERKPAPDPDEVQAGYGRQVDLDDSGCWTDADGADRAIPIDICVDQVE